MLQLIDWGKYINTVYSVVNVSVNSTEKILVEYINYFRQIGTLIYTTPLRYVSRQRGQEISRTD